MNNIKEITRKMLRRDKKIAKAKEEIKHLDELYPSDESKLLGTIYKMLLDADDVTTNRRISHLRKLVEGKPLTPLTNHYGEDWKLIGNHRYRHNRYKHLTMDIFNGDVTYTDYRRFLTVDEADQHTGYQHVHYDRDVTRIMHSLMPITFPYYVASEPHKVYIKDFTVDEATDDISGVYRKHTRYIGILMKIAPNHRVEYVNRYFKIFPDGKFDEINEYIYETELRRRFLGGVVND